uniref:Periplasmic protein n=1 Tax=Caenorhabditis tropicalis TaxID=1561998 RepID=A0A1I7T311_9PELO
MNRFVIASLLLVSFFALSQASVAQQRVKDGEKVEVDAFKGAKAIKRTVAGGEQIFHFDGEHKGSFVDGKGKKVESSNYEAKDGVLVIKKFSKADVGSYSEHPAKNIETKQADGSVSAVPGITLNLSLE